MRVYVCVGITKWPLPVASDSWQRPLTLISRKHVEANGKVLAILQLHNDRRICLKLATVSRVYYVI